MHITDRRVCILHVGGTIGMTPSPRGLVPHIGSVERTLGNLGLQVTPPIPSWDLVRLDPLLDSADMQPRDWVRIADEIASRADVYDGFVVLHGTDTMAYTASALSFLLPGLACPVVLTGAQLSLEHVRSDGREHLITSLLVAGTLPIPEVSIYFGSRLLRGNRSQKVNNRDFIAFRSGNQPPLATAGVAIDVDWPQVRPAGDGLPPKVELSREPVVIALRIFPGISAELLERILAPPTEAVVLETYGAGTFPSRSTELLDAIARAIRRGVIVVNCSQCHRGHVVQGMYGAGFALENLGVVSGHDMTPEAALTKLYCLLGRGEPPERVAQMIAMDLAGEICPRSPEPWT